MAHVTNAVWEPVEQLFGRAHERTWTYPISAAEMRMVVSSTRGQKRLHDVTAFIFNEQNQLALIRKQTYPPGGYRTPGGGINPGEDFVTGALREALEETGLAVRPTRYLLRAFVTFTCGEVEQPWTTHILIGRSEGGTLATQDPAEISGTRWGSLDELCGPMAQALLSTGRGLFRYRVDLHDEVARLLKQEEQAPA